MLGKIEHLSHYMNWYRANKKVFLTRFATYPNIVVTFGLAPNMETEQHPPHQSLLLVANMHDEGLQPHAQSYEFTSQFTPQPHTFFCILSPKYYRKFFH